ncbi:piggyBac transposable element-derived protein 3-like [Prorops nasuta]|uniref:piggyBac transposable element-derived protein 3-like n=1 Tax=Prorops nasuta TaxID=863751 RepID=UPI0034CFC3D2
MPKRISLGKRNSSVPKKSKTTRRNFLSFEIDERNNAAFIPNPDYSGESDINVSDSEIDSEELDTIDFSADESNNNDSENYFTPKKSYARISSEYNNTQKKLEENYIYGWIPGERKYDILHDDLFLSNKDKSFIQSKSFTELFELFFCAEIKNYIIESTKLNGHLLTFDELNIFIGIIIFSSYNKRLSQRDFWSNDPFLHSDPVASAMSRNHFEKIKSKLKFSKPEGNNPTNKIWRVQKIVDIFRKNLLRFGIFSSALSVDEMMVKFFGKLSIKQFIKTKPTRYGIKIWGLGAPNGYLFEFEIYCGKNSEKEILSKVSLGSRVVIRMLQPLLTTTSYRNLDKYHIYMDNLFCSANLIIHLKNLGLKATGTLRKDRTPEKVNFDKNVKRGTFESKYDKKSGTNFITIQDSKQVLILSSAAGVTPLTPMKRYNKDNKSKVDIEFPYAFSAYNRFMGGVDVHDQHCCKLLPSLRSEKWTWVIFLRLIQAAITNVTVLYNICNESKMKVGTKDAAMSISRYYLDNFNSFSSKKRKQQRNMKKQLKRLQNSAVINVVYVQSICALPVSCFFVRNVLRTQPPRGKNRTTVIILKITGKWCSTDHTKLNY